MNNSKKEDGFILVVVIGILTILSLLTITFATLSRIEIRATRNYTDSVKCEMVVKAGLEHAIYLIRYDKFGSNDVAYDDYNSEGDTNYDLSGDNSWPGNTVFPGTDYDNDGANGEDSKWIYFPATDSSSDIRLPGNLRARYAVLITDDKEARVNINVSGNQPGDEGTSTTEIDMSSVIEQAPGLNSADGDNISSNIISTRIVMPFGVLTESEIVGISSASTAYTSRLEEIFESYIGSGWETAYEDRKVVLTAFSADTIVCPPYGTSTTMLNINALVNNEGAYTDTGTYNTNKKIEMLIDILEEGGILDSPGTEKYVECRQLAVNIKDFIDSDSTVTTYDDPSVPGDTYYGVEKTPYINEVEAWTSSGTVEFIELFNPYDTAIPNTGNWTITLDGDTTTITLPGLTIPARGYYVIADQAGAGVDLVYPAGINNLDNGGEELILRDSSGNTVQVTNYGSANEAQTMQLNDPRPTPLENYLGVSSIDPANPWQWRFQNPHTAGIQNSIFDPTRGDDGWTSGTWSPSFLVANRKFSNKGYLGFIHNGRQWSSFLVDSNIAYPNVLQYFTVTDPSMDNIDNDGDGDIDSLDTGSQAGDFDGPEYRIPGLINVNTAPFEVLQSLPNIGTDTAKAIAGEIPYIDKKPFTSIGDLVDRVTEITGSGTKWNKEKTFRSISNLITTRSNVFTVYVTAQIMKEDLSEKYAEKRILAIVDRSVDPIRVRYFRWITE